MQKKLPSCAEKLLEDYGYLYEDAEGTVQEDPAYSWPYDYNLKTGDKLQVWFIDMQTNVLQQLINDENGGLAYVLLEEASAAFDKENHCKVADKLTKEEEEEEKDASLSGIATAASALFLAVVSIAF